jgi:hypothetical protein
VFVAVVAAVVPVHKVQLDTDLRPSSLLRKRRRI